MELARLEIERGDEGPCYYPFADVNPRDRDKNINYFSVVLE